MKYDELAAQEGGHDQTRAPMHWSRDEFVERVAQQLQVPSEDARDRVRAVFGAIREAITIGEFRDVLEQLDPEYADLLA